MFEDRYLLWYALAAVADAAVGCLIVLAVVRCS